MVKLRVDAMVRARLRIRVDRVCCGIRERSIVSVRNWFMVSFRIRDLHAQCILDSGRIMLILWQKLRLGLGLGLTRVMISHG